LSFSAIAFVYGEVADPEEAYGRAPNAISLTVWK